MLTLDPEQKLAGVLVPVFALRGSGDLGVGDTVALREAISWTALQGLRVLQILPVNATGGDSSPYNLLSAMALEPSTIATTPEELPDLSPRAFAEITAKYDLAGLRAGGVQYREVKRLKTELLEAAWQNFQAKPTFDREVRAWKDFVSEQVDWLPDHALHRALIHWHGEDEKATDWPKEHRSPVAVRAWMAKMDPEARHDFENRRDFYSYVQWVAFSQWRAVRAHADREGVALMGDVPVGVSLHSTDVWSHPEIFDTVHSSGAPPEKVFAADPFTEKWGQNWGFPLYDWSAMAKSDYAWWRRRLRLLMGIFHLLRVDHALGFFRIYSFPWRPEENQIYLPLNEEDASARAGGELPHFRDFPDDTEEHCSYNQKHGETLFRMLREEIGRHRLIAEDLGAVAPYVRPTLEDLEVPGFKIPQWERAGDRLTPGADYPRLSLATYATHDHPPLRVLWEELFERAQDPDQGTRDAAIHSQWELMNFCGQPEHELPQAFTPEIHEILLRGLLASNSWLTVPMITDLFGTAERFNVPGSASGENWTKRVVEPVAAWEKTWRERLEMWSRVRDETGRGRK